VSSGTRPRRLRGRGLVSPLVCWLALCTTEVLAGQCPDGTPPPCAGRAVHVAAPAPAANSVAVLYFDNLSRDTTDVFLANGLTEELITRLSQVRRLDVKSRFESLRFRGQPLTDPRALGRAVGAAYLVTGSLQKVGVRERVNVALVQTQTGRQVWGEVYERAGDILAAQAEIAREVAEAITGRLLPEERASLARMPTRDPVAYALYLRGLGAANTMSEAGLRAGLEYLDRAIDRDSGLADAYAQKAAIWEDLSDGYVEGREGYPQAREAAEQALSRDSSLALAWAMLGGAVLSLDVDAPLAIRLSERALSLDPRSAWGHIALAGGLLASGRTDDSVLAEFRRGWEADTLAAGPAWNYLGSLHYLHRDELLPAVAGRMRPVLSPEDERLFDGLARLARGDTSGAVRQLSWSYYGGAYAPEYVRGLLALGRSDAVAAVLDSMRRAAPRVYVNPYAFARCYAALRNADSVYAWLDRAWDQRTAFMERLRTDAEFVPFHDDPRWAALLRRMGLTP